MKATEEHFRLAEEAYDREDRHSFALEAAVRAVLASVAEVPPGPCTSQVEIMNGPPPVRCDLLQGHAGDHRSGLTRWWGI